MTERCLSFYKEKDIEVSMPVRLFLYILEEG